MAYFKSLHPVVQVLLATLFTRGMTAFGSAVVFLQAEFSRKIPNMLYGIAGGYRMIAGGRINMDNPNEQQWIETEELIMQKFLNKLHFNKKVS
jgi:zinc transporter ZupT